MLAITPSTIGLDRARPVGLSHAGALPMMENWHGSDGFGGFTGLVDVADATYVTLGNHTAATCVPVIKHPARHLGTRST